MSSKRFYQLAFLSPVLFPLLVALPLMSGDLLGENFWLTNFIKSTLAISLFALIFGGLPYIVLAGTTLWTIRRSDGPSHQRRFTKLPLAYAPWLWLCYLAFGLLASDGGFADALASSASIAAFGLGIGYVYVGAARLVFSLLKRLGAIREPLAAARDAAAAN